MSTASVSGQKSIEWNIRSMLFCADFAEAGKSGGLFFVYSCI